MLHIHRQYGGIFLSFQRMHAYAPQRFSRLQARLPVHGCKPHPSA